MSIVSCSVDGCDRPLRSRGWCNTHYLRWYEKRSMSDPVAPGKCLACTGVMPPKPEDKRGPHPRYCSPKCRSVAGQRRRIESGGYAQDLAARKAKAELRQLPVHTCIQCAATWTSTHRRSKFCSSKCMNKYQDINNPIRCSEPDCERGVRAKGLCSMHWRRKARAEGREANPVWDEGRKAQYHKRRAQKRGTQVEDLRPIDIYERDIWLCGLCVTPVDPDSAWPDPMSPSLDHIIPLSKGGTHTYENVQLAHLTCNVSKGNRIAA